MEKQFLHSTCKFTAVDDITHRPIIKCIFLTGILAACFAASCKLQEEKIHSAEAWQKKLDSTGNAILDSIYKNEMERYDSLKKNKVPLIVDSMLRADSLRRK